MTCAAILRFSTFVLSTDRPARAGISATRLTMVQRTGISLGLFLGILSVVQRQTPDGENRCDRRLLSALRKLDYEPLRAELYPLLTKSQIKALLARRDRTVEIFNQKIAVLGEDAVLFDLHELRPSTHPIPVATEILADRTDL